jgi:hypothetical protein
MAPSTQRKAGFRRTPGQCLLIHLHNTTEQLAYKITGVCVLEGGTTYLLKFIGCASSAEISSEEMEKMFEG